MLPKPPLISLIFITYNSARVLPACLASLAATRYAPYEVIVVDNASRDTTSQIVREHGAIQLIQSQSNLGFGNACHLGAQIARGELLIFLNPDLSFTPAWLGNLVEALHADPALAICAPVALYPGDRMPADRDMQAPYASATVSGAALMIRRSAWDALGGFDRQIFLYWEDTDLCWRAWLSGLRVAYVPASVIYHERGGSGGGREWASEAAKNGMYVHLKLMRWRRTLPYLLRQIPATLARFIRGQRGAGAIWWWNFQRLGATLMQRETILSQRQIDPAHLEHMITAHDSGLRRRR